MNEDAIRAEIKRRKEVFRAEQAALPFAEKVRIAFELSKRRHSLKEARLIQRIDVLALPSADGTK